MHINLRIIVICLLAIAGIAGILLLNNSQNPGIACTQEAKICPDGTAVSRISPNCEFAACPATGTGIALVTATTHNQDENIEFELQNNSGKPIYLKKNCGVPDFRIYKKDSSGFKLASAADPAISIECWSYYEKNQIELLAGKKKILSWQNPAIYNENGEKIEIAGTYKIVVSYS